MQVLKVENIFNKSAKKTFFSAPLKVKAALQEKSEQTGGVRRVYLGSLDWFLLSGAPGVLCTDTKANVQFKQII